MPASECRIQYACADLGWPDQGAKADGRGKSEATRLQQRQHVDRDHRHDNRGDRQPDGQCDEGGTVAGAMPPRRRRRRIRWSGRRQPLLLTRNAKQIQRQHHGGADGGIGKARTAPA
jgi:hypothetical protein